MRDFTLTSEAHTAGHPDKLCDQISDALVDAHLAADPPAGCIAECALAAGVAFVSVRAGHDLPVDAAALARRVMGEAGYGADPGHGQPTVMLETLVDPALTTPRAPTHRTSRRMATVFGYACDHTPDMMPLPVWAAHRIAAAIDAERRAGPLGALSPDAQAQVAVVFAGRVPVRLSHVAVTVSGVPEAQAEALKERVVAASVRPALEDTPVPLDEATHVGVRTERTGGPSAHSGLTGRKLADDTYGGLCRHGAAALSGKDPARIDRIGAYAARRAARSVVAAGLAREAEVQLCWVGGEERPVSVEVDTFGSGRVDDAAIGRRLAEAFDFRPGAIAEELGLWDLPARHGGVFYRRLAAYGHMGRGDLAAPWETADRPDRLA